MPAYEQFDQLLASIELAVGASELHGVISGLICAGHSDAHVAWFEGLFDNRSSDDLLVREARQSLGQLYLATGHQFAEDGLGFTPFLPDDQAPLSLRSRCLSEWCQGYLYGLGLAGIAERQFQGDAKEAVADISEIGRLDHAAVESGEESEAAFVELVEFLKVASLLIREELASRKEDAR
jgi:uncharacterized protein YgfB (UPF0149 family)